MSVDTRRRLTMAPWSRAALVAAMGLLTLASPQSGARAASDPLLARFQDPPSSARPRVWWHWMNGNITEDGIAKDMAWMKRVGVAGLQNFDAALSTPQVVPNRLAFMTPEWKKAFRFAAAEADRNGLELAIAASPGWSETGGPWVQPKDGMKKLVWSETVIAGGQPFTGRLAAPPSVTGPFQDVPFDPGIAGAMGKPFVPPTHYEDVAVLAVPVTAGGETATGTFSDGKGQPLDAKALADGDLKTTIELPAEGAAIVVAYPSPQTIRSASLFLPGGFVTFFGAPFAPRLEASDDGKQWRKVSEIPASEAPSTASFAPVTAARFRVVFPPNPDREGPSFGVPGADDSFFAMMTAAPKTIRIGELRLSGEARVNQFEAKAGFHVENDYDTLDGSVGPEVKGIAPGDVIDLTGKLQPDGRLDWTPPPGRFKVIRFGASLTGKSNHPATEEATGLEVDKYDGAAVRRYLETYLDMYVGAISPELFGKKGLRALMVDSIEVGASNWSREMVSRFKSLRGYDPTPWLPTLTGVIVGSRAESDAFLFDFRRTLADLVASEHYGTVAKVAHERGLVVYGEALENGRPSLGDDMAMRSHNDIPMAALWTYRPEEGPNVAALPDLKGAASVAHLYGQGLAAAESMTSGMSPWAHSPADLRRVIDLEFAYGINRPVIHTSVHQPVDDKQPGLSLMIFGQFFTRHETWAEMERPWIDYLSRNSLMLQEGRYFADVAYFYGEGAPLTALYNKKAIADAPKRYAYDFINADALRDLVSVTDGDLTAKSGARYRVLYLGGSSRKMSLPVLRRIAALAEAGATIVGKAPAGPPGLEGDASEYAATVRRLWGGGPTTTVGKGRVIGDDVEKALASIGVPPDFRTNAAADSEILFLHRRLEDGDAYFLNNRKPRAEKVEARFRVTGMEPEIWRADTGETEAVSYRTETSETVVPLEIGPEDSFFVVFRKPTSAGSRTVARPAFKVAATLGQPWTVAFPPGRGAPASITLPAPRSLSESTESGVKYFSGVSTWTSTFDAPREWKTGAPLRLDLGRVGDVAEVRVNGTMVGTVWKAPYTLDVGAAAKSGSNTLEVRIANLWANRLIGDQQAGATKVAFVTIPTYRVDAPLRPSGLIGPVTLRVRVD
jgi:hypothetical protein